MRQYTYYPEGVCSREIRFSITDGNLHDVCFEGGCDGNLKAIGKLLEGTDALRAVKLLRGNRCGSRMTSCADQLAVAIEEALEGENS